jgi:hypothetical protein
MVEVVLCEVESEWLEGSRRVTNAAFYLYFFLSSVLAVSVSCYEYHLHGYQIKAVFSLAWYKFLWFEPTTVLLVRLFCERHASRLRLCAVGQPYGIDFQAVGASWRTSTNRIPFPIRTHKMRLLNPPTRTAGRAVCVPY